MKTSKATAALWDNANRRNAARIGIGDRAAAFHQIPTIKQLIGQIGTDPNALELLASRSHELTPAQRLAALKAFAPPKEPKAPKTTKAPPRALTPGARRLANFGLYGKSGAPRS